MLIGYISLKNPIEEATLINNKWKYEKEIIKIGSNYSGIIQQEEYLWLTVNDAWIDQKWFTEIDSKFDSIRVSILYLGDKSPVALAKYLLIKNNDYSHLWYDDNNGSFLVNISIK